MEHVTGIAAEHVLRISAQDRARVPELLEAASRNPAAGGGRRAAAGAGVDSKFDQYRGVVALVRVVDGRVRSGDTMRL